MVIDTKEFFAAVPHLAKNPLLARISHQCVDTWAKGIDEDLRKEDRLN